MVKAKKLITFFLVIFIIISMACMFGLMMLSLFYYFNGSLEMYPTEEQMEKVRIGATCILIGLTILEVTLALSLKAIISRIKRKGNA